MGYVEGLLGNNEKIVIKTRQHWMVMARSLVVNLVIVIAILVLAVFAIASNVPFAPAISILFIFPVAAFMRDYLEWWNEEYYVTNRRVIQADGVFSKHVIDSSLEKVNDVVLSQSLFGRMLDYGTIEILTASEIGVNQLRHIAEPVKFKTEMLNQKEGLGIGEPFTGGPARRDDVPSLIAELDELRKQGVLTEEEFRQKKAQLLAKM